MCVCADNGVCITYITRGCVRIDVSVVHVRIVCGVCVREPWAWEHG